MSTDLYEEIGVDRRATEAEIRKAYRAKAKRAHPDAGGTAEGFARLSTALVVLTDPRRRQTYDETGRVDAAPDNDRAMALEMIEQQMQALVMGFLKDWNPAADPRRMDVPAVIAARLEDENAKATTALIGGRNVVKFLRDMEERFKRKRRARPGDNVLARGFRLQVEQNERNIAQLEHSIAVRRTAVEIVREHEFRYDDVRPQRAWTGGVTTAWS